MNTDTWSIVVGFLSAKDRSNVLMTCKELSTIPWDLDVNISVDYNKSYPDVVDKIVYYATTINMTTYLDKAENYDKLRFGKNAKKIIIRNQSKPSCKLINANIDSPDLQILVLINVPPKLTLGPYKFLKKLIIMNFREISLSEINYSKSLKSLTINNCKFYGSNCFDKMSLNELNIINPNFDSVNLGKCHVDYFSMVCERILYNNINVLNGMTVNTMVIKATCDCARIPYPSSIKRLYIIENITNFDIPSGIEEIFLSSVNYDKRIADIPCKNIHGIFIDEWTHMSRDIKQYINQYII